MEEGGRGEEEVEPSESAGDEDRLSNLKLVVGAEPDSLNVESNGLASQAPLDLHSPRRKGRCDAMTSGGDPTF